MGLDKRQRAEHKAIKENRVRKERRRMKLWNRLQNRVYTDKNIWDDEARNQDNIEHYRKMIDRDCGIDGDDAFRG